MQLQVDHPAQPPLIVLLGPTAVGKTALSMSLCRRFNGEVVSADSRLIYRGMDIGTAKPSPAEQQAIPHHLIDIRNPNEILNVSQYQALAYTVIDQIHARDRVPFLVGGSALYLRAVVQGLRIPEVPPNPPLRAELETFAAAQGGDALFQRLADLDPKTAAQTDPKNIRRVIRALEIFITTGQSKVTLEGADPPPYRILQIGLDRERPHLYARIDQRVEQMVAAGLVAEVQQLRDAGYGLEIPALRSFGYREIFAHLQNEMTLDEAIARIKVETHRFARHQYTWFRKMTAIQWFDLGCDELTPIDDLVAHFLAEG